MSYVKRRWKPVLTWAVVILLFNLYFYLFIQDEGWGYLGYMDILFLVPSFLWGVADYVSFHRREGEKALHMAREELICRGAFPFENRDMAEHDVSILEKQLKQQFDENCELQDYVAKWCHEVKLPLSAALLMTERMTDMELKQSMREQWEKINQQLQSMLLGCKLQSPLLDLQIRPVSLEEMVKASIRNQRFFLIQKRFALEMQVEHLEVFTDPDWLIYVLDQLISNAVKYARSEGEAPLLHLWSETQGMETRLYIEDHGEGIREEDMGRIFEKGFTGRNHHNGQHKSTGMGLYMVSRVLKQLGHPIHVESRYKSYTRFCIVFLQEPYYFPETVRLG